MYYLLIINSVIGKQVDKKIIAEIIITILIYIYVCVCMLQITPAPVLARVQYKKRSAIK